MLHEIDARTKHDSKYFEVADGVWGMKDIFVNFYMVSNPDDNTWALIDTGIKTSASKIKKMASEIFGKGARPSCIILTHAHFDHAGSLQTLIEEWNVPVYAHHLELPYLTGKSSYPPPDPTVGGGIMPLMSVVFPLGPINIRGRASVLSEDGTVPGLPEWKFFHTPGHAPGHVSLYRKNDGVLIAGDAFITTNQQSALSILFQTKKLMGPPKYFTYDWKLAKQSIKELMDLEPQTVATGHGKPMTGSQMRKDLHDLYNNFNKKAVPGGGRYVKNPAVADATGFIFIPPATINKRAIALTALSITAAAAAMLVLLNKKKKNRRPLMGTQL
ncbi:MAG TPA: MBL fold metallo-hydrolase [Chitinophagaceae bacterium]|nr:MBL fold metallo-hydrolase [Chitinophagaceae bacterium]